MPSIRATLRRANSPFLLGVAFIILVAVIGLVIFMRQQITVALTSGQTVTVRFAENYGVRAYDTDVKIAGISVGDVTDVAREADNGTTVTVKIDGEAYDTLRSAPAARVRPATLLGGNYYVELIPGGQRGDFGGEIPVERTSVPVELDKVIRALQPDSLQSLRGVIGSLDDTLGSGSDELRELLANAPDTLEPAGSVLQSSRGTRPEVDLPALVDGLHTTAAALTERQGQLAAILDGFDATTAVLGDRAADMGHAVRRLPATLDSANAGLSRLGTSLDTLSDTAGPAQPIVQELDATLERLDPVLVKTRPLVSDLNDALADAQPLVEALVPTARDATAVLDDVRGPVLERVRGPVLDTVRSPWRGSGPYEGGGGDFEMYKALAYALSGIAAGTSQTDDDGNQFGIAITAGPGSVAGLPINLAQLFATLVGHGEEGDR